jgi:hypothetical protein
MNRTSALRTGKRLCVLIAVVVGLFLAFYDFLANVLIAGATGAVRLMGSVRQQFKVFEAEATVEGEIEPISV